MDFFKEFAELAYTKAESFFLKGVNSLLDFTNGHGAFAIAVALIISIALFFFAKNSLKVYRVALPLAAIIFGSWAASRICTRIINYFFPSMVEYIDPAYLSGIAAAVVLAFFCIKYYRFATIALGAGVGLVFLVPVVSLFFKTSDIVMTIVGMSSPRVVEAIEILAIHVCMLLTAFIFFKWFKPIYVFITTVLGTAASFGVITFFAFKITDYTVKITLVACAIGAIVGLFFCANQLKEHKHDFNRPPCKRCAKENKKKAKAAAKKAKKNNKKAKAAA